MADDDEPALTAEDLEFFSSNARTSSFLEKMKLP